MLIVIDTARNQLQFELDAQGRGGEILTVPADLDIGERGHLLGLELQLPDQPPQAIVLDDRADPYARTARVEATCLIGPDGALRRVTVPRRGPGYELSYPSGNECWIDASGARHCAITRSG